MKKTLGIAAALALVAVIGFGSGASVYADTATSTPVFDGHPHALLAGTSDSINNRGAWLLENIPGLASPKISYVVDKPASAEEIRVKAIYTAFITKWFLTAR